MINLAPLPAAFAQGQVDSTSTSTAFTATIPGVFAYYDGLAIMLKNGVVTSASGFTININGLGAKPVYSNMAAETRETTIFNVNYTLLLIYDSTRVEGGCWINYRGYYAVDSVNGQTGDVTLTASDVGALPDNTSIPSKTSDLKNDSGYITGMYIASYGHSTYAAILAAYKANKVVYCRASSNSDPASGAQTRMAFMAYVKNPTTPTEIEFQYYRSVSSHSDSQQGDQVFVYRITSAGTWSVTVREAYTKIVAGTNMSSSYSNGVLTLTSTGGSSLPTPTASDNGKFITVVNGAYALANLPVYNGGVS